MQMAIVLRHATTVQFMARLRQRFAEAEGAEALRLARRVHGWVTAGDITDAELRAAFSLTAAQVTALKDRLATRAAQHDAVIAARGE